MEVRKIEENKQEFIFFYIYLSYQQASKLHILFSFVYSKIHLFSIILFGYNFSVDYCACSKTYKKNDLILLQLWSHFLFVFPCSLFKTTIRNLFQVYYEIDFYREIIFVQFERPSIIVLFVYFILRSTIK